MNRPEPVRPANIEDRIRNEEEELEVVEPPTREEIIKAINTLKNNKAAGIDEVSAELIKYGGRKLHDKVVIIVLEIWNEEIMPENWDGE